MVTTKPTQEKLMKTVYCLYRVSTKGQVDKNDIPMQKQSCREFAENQPGWVIKKEFQEQGVSGLWGKAHNQGACVRKARYGRKYDWLSIWNLAKDDSWNSKGLWN